MIEQHDFQDSVLFLSVYGYMLIEFSFLLNPRYPRALKAIANIKEPSHIGKKKTMMYF